MYLSESDLLRALRALVNEARNVRLHYTDAAGMPRSVKSYDLAAPLRALIEKTEGNTQ